MEKLRIVTLRSGAGRQKMFLERWTNPNAVGVATSATASREIGGRRETAS
jgi:hypothetical protein